jgi:dipeptidyl aminopeptidase/acylaminoacyl peptidase
MSPRRVLPYGSWPSTIDIGSAVAASLQLRSPRFDGGDLYWLEGRPAEGGRQLVVRRSADGLQEDLTPGPYNVRTRAHEYGGGEFLVNRGVVYFSNFTDGRLYRQPVGGEVEPLTPPAALRYADMVADDPRGRLICVVEDHRALAAGGSVGPIGGRIPEPANWLAAVDLETGALSTLAQGYDFYSTPRLSPGGSRLAWLSWRHPNMPWDGCELWLADVGDGGEITDARMVAGGTDESIVQPEWAPDGALVYVSDRTGWWNLYRLPPPLTGAGHPLCPMAAEFAGPQWVFGLSWYGIDADGTIIAKAHRNGTDELWRIAANGDAAAGPAVIDLPHSEVRDVVVSNGRAAFIGGRPDEPDGVVLLEVATGKWEYLRRSSESAPDPATVSLPQHIEFRTTGGATAHALFYPPVNPLYEGLPDELPPLIVMSHGGPTSRASSALALDRQIFTSRGLAVVDVDYGGSNGYGRDYMRRLDGSWGVVDVDDCINAARYLAGRGLVDPKRMAIRGGSAGGFTTLAALVFHDLFAAGASHYGVGDLEGLARDTHKFESHYLDRLVAPYPEGLELYRARSPIHFTERISCPLLVLQGLDDQVVPRAQAEQLVAALHERRIPYAYLPFAGEGHGFRDAANITRALEAELSFYGQVFGFDVADAFEPVSVEFLANA